MNTIRTIEGATLISVGVFCAAAILNIGLHTTNLLPSTYATATTTTAAITRLPSVVITGHRLTAADKAAVVVDSGSNDRIVHAG